jgi:hypothetical protein
MSLLGTNHVLYSFSLHIILCNEEIADTHIIVTLCHNCLSQHPFFRKLGIRNNYLPADWYTFVWSSVICGIIGVKVNVRDSWAGIDLHAS